MAHPMPTTATVSVERERTTTHETARRLEVRDRERGASDEGGEAGGEEDEIAHQACRRSGPSMTICVNRLAAGGPITSASGLTLVVISTESFAS